MLVFEALYDTNGKDNEKKAVDLKFNECKVFMTQIEQELFDEEDGE